MIIPQEDLIILTEEEGEGEENDFKRNLSNMIETFKEEFKNCLKEMEEKTNKNWKKLINLSKKPRETRGKKQ